MEDSIIQKEEPIRYTNKQFREQFYNFQEKFDQIQMNKGANSLKMRKTLPIISARRSDASPCIVQPYQKAQVSSVRKTSYNDQSQEALSYSNREENLDINTNFVKLQNSIENIAIPNMSKTMPSVQNNKGQIENIQRQSLTISNNAAKAKSSGFNVNKNQQLQTNSNGFILIKANNKTLSFQIRKNYGNTSSNFRPYMSKIQGQHNSNYNSKSQRSQSAFDKNNEIHHFLSKDVQSFMGHVYNGNAKNEINRRQEKGSHYSPKQDKKFWSEFEQNGQNLKNKKIEKQNQDVRKIELIYQYQKKKYDKNFKQLPSFMNEAKHKRSQSLMAEKFPSFFTKLPQRQLIEEYKAQQQRIQGQREVIKTINEYSQVQNQFLLMQREDRKIKNIVQNENIDNKQIIHEIQQQNQNVSNKITLQFLKKLPQKQQILSEWNQYIEKNKKPTIIQVKQEPFLVNVITPKNHL